jgi:hypothetical protein
MEYQVLGFKIITEKELMARIRGDFPHLRSCQILSLQTVVTIHLKVTLDQEALDKIKNSL